MTIKLNQPIKPDLDILTEYLKKVNERGWYTNFGPLYDLLTQRLERFLGVENLLLVSNGTLALQVTYKTLGVKKAVTTPFSFVATTSSLLWEGIETQFSDIDPQSGNLCPKLLEETLASSSSIDTVVATHIYGNPCDVEALKAVAVKHGVNLIYDAAHAFGINVNKESILEYGDASILSFHATKIFHTIEGGAIVFKRKDDYEKAKRLINFGYNENAKITEVGINAKLNEYQCAVGLTNLETITDVLEHRVNLFELYNYRLKDFFEMPSWHPQANKNGIYMPVIMRSNAQREELKKIFDEKNIEYREYYSPSLDSIFEKKCNIENSICKSLTRKVICLPLHFYLTEKDIHKVSDTMVNFLS